jgi:hypothetical protein
MNTATRFSVGVRRNLCLTSSNLKRHLFLATNGHEWILIHENDEIRTTNDEGMKKQEVCGRFKGTAESSGNSK